VADGRRRRRRPRLAATADGGLAAQGAALAGNGGGDLGQAVLGGGQQLVALTSALGAEQRIAAGDEALAGVISARSRRSNSAS
jgi:hypothetical protein